MSYKIPAASTSSEGVSKFDAKDVSATSGLIQLKHGLQIGTHNLGITLAAGTFTVCGYDGTALSATNPAYITMPSKAAPGVLLTTAVTANQTFIDDAGVSTIIGNLFGLTTGIAWANDAPFYLYAVINDAANAILFAISRVPHMTVAPAAATFGKTGSAVASTQASFFALGNPTVTDYEGNPCICIGSFRMRMSAADDWTVQALAVTDGIGCFNEQTSFTMPLGQMGASAGTYLLPHGGTAPIFANYNNYSYHMSRDGWYDMFVDMQADGGTDGAGAVFSQVSMPYSAELGITYSNYVVTNNATNAFQMCVSQAANTTLNPWWVMYKISTAAANLVLVNNGDYTNGARAILGTLRFKSELA